MRRIARWATAAFALALAQPAGGASIPSDGIDFRDIPPARSAQEAYERFDAVGQRVIDHFAQGILGPYSGNNGIGFAMVAQAKLARGEDIELINRTLLDPSSTVYARVGSDFHDLGFLCERTGDYDFMLRGMVALTYRFGDDPRLIWPETRRRLIDYFLDQKGGEVLEHVSFGLCGTHDETENHVLMTEGSRYLTNQLVLRDLLAQGRYDARYDNSANGMTEWMLKHLQKFLRRDFHEYNSRPYQAYTVMALQNIYEFAWDARVKTAAELVMNYLDARYALSSDNLRRLVPFRRHPEYRTRTDVFRIDDESMRFVLMAGDTELFDELPVPGFLEFGFDEMLNPALGSYRTPEPILDLIVDRDHSNYFQGFHHEAIELYASSPDFLITAGGVYDGVWDWFSKEMNGWAVATSLMPTHGGLDASQFIRIQGQEDDSERINTCIAPGFACGMNPVVPDSIPASCRERWGNWTFVDFTSERCPLKYGFFAAVYTQGCDDDACGIEGDTFGFFEAEEPRPGLGYGEFKQRVLAWNGARRFSSTGENDYVLATGHRVRFVPIPSDAYDWGIRQWDGRDMTTEMKRWPLAFGDIMRANGSGRVVFRNPYLRRKLVLDYSDAMNPWKRDESY